MHIRNVLLTGLLYVLLYECTYYKLCIVLLITYYTGTLTVEEVYKDRDQFASLVREVAAPDVGRMGIEILSFTIKDVYDNVTYLASLGELERLTWPLLLRPLFSARFDIQ